MADRPTKELRVEVNAQTYELLEQWSRQTGKSLAELFGIAFTLLKAAMDKELIKEEPSGAQFRLTVS